MNNPTEILKFLENSSSSIEDQKVMDWLNDNQENNTVLGEYEHILRELDEIKDYKSFDIDSEWGSFKAKAVWDSNWNLEKVQPAVIQENEVAKVINMKPQSNIRSLNGRSVMSIAAALLVLVAASWFMFPSQPEFKTYVSGDLQEHFELADGTHITLLENSTLIAPTSFDDKFERRVKVNGKAVFDVATNPNRPFIVDATTTEVKVLGTIFVVDKREEDIVLENIEGKVKFYEKGNESQGIILNQGDKIRFSANEGFEDMNSVPEPVKVEPPKPKVKPNLGTSFNHGYVMEKIMLKSEYKIMPASDLDYNPSARVYVNIDNSLEEIISELQTKMNLEMAEKDCEGCFEIVSFSKK